MPSGPEHVDNVCIVEFPKQLADILSNVHIIIPYQAFSLFMIVSQLSNLIIV